jgi:glucose/arabinose dehydrogenase
MYVAYTYRGRDGLLWNRLVRLREDAGGRGAFDKILVDGVRGNRNHNGGRVKFGPDGKLYWTMGEAWMRDLAQDLTSLNGKILRLNPDGSVPDDNPFHGSLIYTYGNRNCQGLAWQPGTGRLYATEHGPSGEWKGYGQDEINLIMPGANYGWPVIAGNEKNKGMVSPIIQSGMDETWAPSGAAFVTQGLWKGSFVFAGLKGETLYRLILDPDDPEKVIKLERHLAGSFGRLRDVVEGPDGALYVTTSNRDRRGEPTPTDDRILRVVIK